MGTYFGYVLLGSVIGFMSGVFGVGGSSIATPMLKMLFPVPDLFALASPLPVTIPTALSSAFTYWRNGRVRKEVVFWSTLGGLPGVVAGALGTKLVTGPWLMILTGLFVVAVGLRLVYRTKAEQGHGVIRPASVPLKAGLTGLVIGTLSGLLANGGGFLLVPAFIILLGLTMQEAAASSLVCVAIFAVPGTLVHWWLGNIDWILVLCLSIGVMPASYFGAKLAFRVAGERVRTAFGLFLAIFGVDFMLTQMHVSATITFSILAVALICAISWTVLGLRQGPA